MMTSIKLFVCLSGLILFLPFIANAQVKDSVWIQDPKGCKVFNPNPVKDETISWTGACANGYASGRGTLVWYKKGKLNQEYVGDMQRGKPHGKGRYLFENGTKREGTYRNGQLDGEGEIVHLHANGKISSTYRGKFKGGKRSGAGVETELNEKGDTISNYTGEFHDDQMHGKGTWKEFDDTAGKVVIIFTGEFSESMRNGYGEEVTGSVRYLGHWKDDQRMGEGKMYLNSMLIYDGQWQADKFNGMGKRFFFDGSSYAGDFKDNTRHGVGIHYLTDGTRYIGEFANDLYSDHGYLIKDGTVSASGKWEKGKLVSPVDVDAVSSALFVRHKDKLITIGISLPR